MVNITWGIISIIADAAFFFVMRIDLYTDRYHLPDGKMGEHRRSMVSSLFHADMNWLYYVEILFMAVSIVTSILLMLGLKNSIVKIIQIVSTVASAVLFIVIWCVASKVHLKY